jgi:hypothetical protein
MRQRWSELDVQGRSAFQTVFAFVLPRLEDSQALAWAIQLTEKDLAKRIAVLEAVDRNSRTITEPWRTAWRLIEECWDAGPAPSADGTTAYAVQKRLQQGERSGALVRFIADLVAPRMKLRGSDRPARHPRALHQLLSVRLTSGTCLDPAKLGLATLTEPDFLFSLAHALNAALSQGLDIARRTGWDSKSLNWRLGSLRRVYHVTSGEDPDRYNTGIAPSAKLLLEVVRRLAALEPNYARIFAAQWHSTASPLHLRLWAALALNPALADAEQVSTTLASLNDVQFWDPHSYPELTELRARRFRDFDGASQSAIATRIRLLPPRRLWRRVPNRAEVDRYREERALLEFRRVLSAGATLIGRNLEWVESRRTSFPEVPDLVPATFGFLLGSSVHSVGSNPDRAYDTLSGEDRLRALNTALSESRRHWDDDPAQRAFDWIREGNNAFSVVRDLETIADAGASYPEVWRILGSTHTRPQSQPPPDGRNVDEECALVFGLIDRLPDTAARQDIYGIAQWLSEWSGYFNTGKAPLWLRLWPMAVEETNVRDALRRSEAARAAGADDSDIETDTINTPTGHLVGLFLSACPEFRPGDQPFAADPDLRAMRDALLLSTGRARLVTLHRLVEDLPYFLSADREWAEAQLVSVLNSSSPQSVALWNAIARQTRFHDVLPFIGEAMIQQATNFALGRETRDSLVFSLVVECLHAFVQSRPPSVAHHRVQQMLRSVDDESRLQAAYALQRFLSDNADSGTAPQDLFVKAVAPFLRDVWPQERSLVTPGISGALAKLPAAAIAIFAQAVATIERFLVPFSCWGLSDYGFLYDDAGTASLEQIDNSETAVALLRLLDLTVGSPEGSVIPSDLSEALQKVRTVAPHLVADRSFRRLSVAARLR